MNRQGLQELVRQQLGGTATPMAAQLALEAVLRGIRQGLREDGEVKLVHFGTFKTRRKAARNIKLPQSERTIQLPEHITVSFKSR